MACIACNICGMANDLNSAKCEYCKCSLLQINSSSKNKSEDDDGFVEKEELNIKTIALASCDNHDLNTVQQIIQTIKEEPEIHIDCGWETTAGQQTKNDDQSLYGTYDDKCESDLRHHLSSNHSKTTSNNLCLQTDEIKNKKLKQCDICGAYLAYSVKEHKMRVHIVNSKPTAQPKKYTCIMCAKQFPFQILLANHMELHKAQSGESDQTILRRVNNKMTFTCKLCGKVSTNKASHTVHLKTHSQERPFECEMCGFRFRTTSALRYHRRLHSDESPFKCDICAKNYRHKGDLKRHLARHLDPSENEVKCDYCDSTFSRSTTKDIHVRLVHTRETPYKCEICATRFVTSRLLNHHRRQVHKIVTNNRRVAILVNNAAALDS